MQTIFLLLPKIYDWKFQPFTDFSQMLLKSTEIFKWVFLELIKPFTTNIIFKVSTRNLFHDRKKFNFLKIENSK